MEPLRRFREQLQRLAARAVGQDTRLPRHTQGMMRWTGMEADVLRMPVDPFISQPLQNGDGTFIFVVDGDPVDSPIAGIG